MGDWVGDVLAILACAVLAAAIARRPSCPRVRRLRSGTIAAVRLRRRDRP